MFNKYSIGNYYLKDSLIHKLNPVFKIISLLLSIITVLIANDLIDFIILFTTPKFFSIFLSCPLFNKYPKLSLLI